MRFSPLSGCGKKLVAEAVAVWNTEEGGRASLETATRRLLQTQLIKNYDCALVNCTVCDWQ
jgi:hypothetical protein